MKGKIIAASMVLALSITSVTPAGAVTTNSTSVSYKSGAIPIIVDGREIVCDQPPVIIHDRTLVPLRAIFEALGANVNWYDATKTVTATKGTTKISLTIGSSMMYKNGEALSIDYAGEIINNRTMVPVRAISEAFGAKVEWDNDNRTVHVYTVDSSEPSDPDNPGTVGPTNPDNPNNNPNTPPVVDGREEKYHSAMSLYASGYSYQAYYAFRDLGDYKDSVRMMENSLLLNKISYNFNDYTSKWFVAHVNDFKAISESDIPSIITQGSWLCPGSQYLGYSIDNFLPNGIRLHNDSMTMRWYVDLGGIFSTLDIPYNTINTINTIILQKDFRQLTEGVYADIIVNVSTPINSGAYTDIYIKKGSSFGNSYEACMERQESYLNTGSYFVVRQDGNGLNYLVPIDPYSGAEMGGSIPS